MDRRKTTSPAALDAGSRFPGQLAAIDIGSNSFRLEIGQIIQERYRRVDYLKETVRLGAGLDREGMLNEEAAVRGLACLERFAKRLEGYQPSQVRAVATQTLREARNRNVFLQRATAVLGLPIDVISGREEARLIFAGVARLQPSTVPRLVVDIGGRSTEMIIGRGNEPFRAESFSVGSVSLSMRYFADGRFSEGAFRQAQVAAGAELEEALAPFAPTAWQEALGSSGTVGAVSQLLAASQVSDGRITAEGLRWLMARCLEAGRVDRLALPGLKEDRRAVIAGGLSILYTLAMQFGIDELLPARGALRQGVIFDLDARRAVESQVDGKDVRDGSVGDLQRRFRVDREQANRVGRIAMRLYAAIEPDADREARHELLWASALHEAGMMISHHDHHRHSAYVLSHVDAPGFSQSQLRRIGDLVLGQRGGLKKLDTAMQQPGFATQALCLRVAVILCHARTDVDVRELEIERDGNAWRLDVPRDWAEAHLRSVHLLQEESEAWSRGAAFEFKMAAV